MKFSIPSAIPSNRSQCILGHQFMSHGWHNFLSALFNFSWFPTANDEVAKSLTLFPALFFLPEPFVVLPLRECASLFRSIRDRDHKEAMQGVILLTIKCSGSLRFHIPGFNPSSILVRVRDSSGSLRFCSEFHQGFKAWQNKPFSGLFFHSRGLKTKMKNLCS